MQENSCILLTFMLLDIDLTAPWVFNATYQWNATRQSCCASWAGLASLCSPYQQPTQGSCASIRTTLSAGLQHPTPCPFEPASQPAQRQFLILLVHLCFGHPCFTAPYRRLMGKRFCQGREGGRAGGQMFLDMAWHLQNCCSR